MKFLVALKVVEGKDTVQRAREGDRKAFDTLVKQNYGTVYNYIKSILTKYPDDIEDIAQETFIKAYENIKSFNGKSTVKTWLCAIARNTAYTHLREQASKYEIVSIDEISESREDLQKLLEEVFTSEITPDAELFAQEIFEQVQEVVDGLDQKYQELFILRFIDQLEYEEIAEVLKLPLGTLKSRMHELNLIIKSVIKEYSNV